MKRESRKHRGMKTERMMDGTLALKQEQASFYEEETWQGAEACSYQQDTSAELTRAGMIFCAGAGLAEEILIYVLFGLSLQAAPLIVTCFLWFLLAMLTAGVLFTADYIRVCVSLLPKTSQKW